MFAAAADDIVSDGEILATTPAEMMAGCDYIGICVRDDTDVESVVAGEQGLLRAPREGVVIAIHSTVKPETIEGMAEQAAAVSVQVLGVPMTGFSRCRE